jgi:hypothetical protein
MLREGEQLCRRSLGPRARRKELPVIELSIRFTAESDDAPIRVSLFRPDSGVSTDPAALHAAAGRPALVPGAFPRLAHGCGL